MKKIFLVVLSCAIFAGFFIFLSNIVVAKVLISKIQTAGVSTTDEFIELYNSSNTPIVLKNWSLKKQTGSGTNNNLVSAFPDAVINPFAYFLVSHHDYQIINNTPADIFYTNNSFSLADNNSLLLFDPAGLLMDQADWGNVNTIVGKPASNTPPGQSLTRLPNTNEGNGNDTDDSSMDFIITDSLPFNSFSPARPAITIATSTCTDAACSPTSTPTTTPPATPTTTTATTTTPTSTIWPQIKINEFLPDPDTGNEWIELYNPTTSSLDLTGGTLCDSRTSTSCTIASPTSTILPNSWLTIFLSSSRLNNDGDSIVLKNPEATIIDQMTYTGNLIPKTGQAVARKNDGADSNNDAVDWAITTQPTQGAANIIVVPMPPSGGGSGGGYSPINQTPTSSCRDVACYVSTSTTSTTPTPISTSTPTIIFNELFPNPAGSDLTDEFIELKNVTSQTINLSGWKISDTTKTFSLSGNTVQGGLVVFSRPATGIALNNTSAEDLRLINPAGVIVDLIKYDRAEEGVSYSRDDDGKWYWTEDVTKGAPNIITAVDKVGVVWKIIAPKIGTPGESLTFDAADSADPRGGKIAFSWNFGDAASSTLGDEVTHIFATSGIYTIIINATSTAGTTDQKKLTLTIGQESAANNSVIISEIFSNPTGADSKEFIELFNTGSTTVDLAGWKLSNQGGTPFIFAAETLLPPAGYLAFYRAATHLSLDNDGDKVTLFSPRNEIVDVVKYGRSVAGLSYTLINNEWRWTQTPSPGSSIAGAVLGEKITATPQATKHSGENSRVYRAPILLALADARTQEKGTPLKINGIVTVPPGNFSSQYFYVGDGSAGMQIYLNKKNFPVLARGDKLSAAGTLSVAQGIPRLNIKTPAAIDILATNQTIAPALADLDSLDESQLGNLIQITGDITELKTNYLYLDDGNSEIMVSFKKGSKITTRDFKIGDRLQVAGIIEQAKNGWQIWPRGNDDIIMLGPSATELQKQAESLKNQQASTAKKYIFATAGGIILLLLALLVRFKETWIKKLIEKK